MLSRFKRSNRTRQTAKQRFSPLAIEPLEARLALSHPNADLLSDVLAEDQASSVIHDPIGKSFEETELLPLADRASEAPSISSQANLPVREAFQLERIKDDFLVFEDMKFDNEPNFLKDYPLQPLRRLATGFFWDATEDRSEPDLARVRTVASELDPGQLVVLNVEHWPSKGDPEVVADTVRKLSSMVDAMREVNPSLTIGIYSVLPIRDYWTPVNFDSGTERYDGWVDDNLVLQELAEHVDVILPSIYTFYPDYYADGSPRLFERDRWIEYATDNLLQAQQYGKPVIPYVWPYYHGGGGTIDVESPSYRYWKYQPIGDEFWRQILETTYQYADGVVIWSGLNSLGVDNDWNGDIGWWTEQSTFSTTLARFYQQANQPSLAK